MTFGPGRPLLLLPGQETPDREETDKTDRNAKLPPPSASPALPSRQGSALAGFNVAQHQAKVENGRKQTSKFFKKLAGAGNAQTHSSKKDIGMISMN